MILSMDLNASPIPEEDDEPYGEQVEGEIIHEERAESAVATMRREREERKRRLKRESQDEGIKRFSQPLRSDFMPQNRSGRSYGRVKEVPRGWLDCPSYGQCIGYIIPSKVPLDETYNDSVVPGKRYSSRQVINKHRRAGRELGLVIDLTNTTRYYSPSEWTNQGIKHVKIPCKGRDAVPDNESVNTFVYEVMQFLSRQKHSKKHILVHCTHGHNRTGFMIIHFLMRTQLLHVSDALHIFAQARPPGIYKQDYIESLYLFYHESPENLVCPPTPEWKRSSDLDLNGEAVQDDDDDGDPATFSNVHMENKIITNDDVLGDAIPYDQQDSMRQICYQLLDLTPSVRGNAQFPGSHPVSLNRDNLQLLRQRYYYATWKADGTRYMMLITTHGCYLIDRNFCFRRVQMRFPLKNNEGSHNLTLIDGEMIIDTLPDTGLKRRYLAYDLVALNSNSVVKLPFADRWKLLEEEVVRPRNHERKQFECEGKCNSSYRYDMEPFSVRRKDFWLLSTVVKLLKEFIPKLSHAADGLIFQGWDDPYVPRTHEGLLKWKYPELNSVDFLFEVASEGRQILFLFERGKKKLMDGAQVLFKGEEDVSSHSGKIIECSWDADEGCWVCMRIRTDKATPNDINTYRKVMRSINDNITEEVLLDEIAEIVRLPMYADRILRAQQFQHRRR
ncbi:mRNA-capping enzyme-like [Phoenix dactylifera]|uniref:mRNA guanylyltransferase n=1 Tax=Phoenix dactylifera TaxID=42345 RepID=A0A8B7BY23_PHODC|nr:mRNA-capping enzyme-like [Phoenix dactylifera]XP_008787728.1 mRNA-capping enzyme-like [Phoenix dactylifera]XP_008787729.1 mRNA-capping enzyme-like [Phoenix dactylifera]XP_026659910.1 mRNA-capping enzyme-like [Phoenix dactylifera]